MATIAVPLDTEEGHTLPKFALLNALKARGHQICFLGVADVQGLVRDHGYDFLPIPIQQNTGSSRGLRYLSPLLNGVLDDAIAQLKPDVVIASSNYYTEGLIIHYRYKLPIVYFTTLFRKKNRAEWSEAVIINTLLDAKGTESDLIDLFSSGGAKFKSLKDIARLVLQFPELMLLPEAFDLPGRSVDEGVYYIGAGIDLERREPQFQWDGVDPLRPLIYCALGSQAWFMREIVRNFFYIVMDVAREHPEWQFILAVGKGFDLKEFAIVSPSNVKLASWVPQLEILSRSDVMINHAGFGSIKECVLMGVPMVVLPLVKLRDHIPCAECVLYHGLGLKGDIERISAKELGSLIDQILRDQSFRHRVALMQEKFRQQDNLELGVKVVEDVIQSSVNRWNRPAS